MAPPRAARLHRARDAGPHVRDGRRPRGERPGAAQGVARGPGVRGRRRAGPLRAPGCAPRRVQGRAPQRARAAGVRRAAPSTRARGAPVGRARRGARAAAEPSDVRVDCPEGGAYGDGAGVYGIHSRDATWYTFRWEVVCFYSTARPRTQVNSRCRCGGIGVRLAHSRIT